MFFVKIIDIKTDFNYLKEYVKLCYLEWSNKEKNLDQYVEYKISKILNEDKVISILGLVDDKNLIGLFHCLNMMAMNDVI